MHASKSNTLEFARNTTRPLIGKRAAQDVAVGVKNSKIGNDGDRKNS